MGGASNLNAWVVGGERNDMHGRTVLVMAACWLAGGLWLAGCSRSAPQAGGVQAGREEVAAGGSGGQDGGASGGGGQGGGAGSGREVGRFGEESTVMANPVTKSDEEWRKALSREQYDVLREKGTERAFTGKYWKTPSGPGEYRCAGCGAVLFRGTDKFVSECGWPAFDKAIKGTIRYHTDKSLGMVRTEVTCARCGGHLGHVFNDGPTGTGVRYCINSVSIDYVPDDATHADAPTEAGGE